MIKAKIWIFIAVFLMILSGCGKEEAKPLKVYSFSGENDQIAVSNGVIILSDTEETFSGGQLKTTGAEFIDITSYFTNFILFQEQKKRLFFLLVWKIRPEMRSRFPENWGKYREKARSAGSSWTMQATGKIISILSWSQEIRREKKGCISCRCM